MTNYFEIPSGPHESVNNQWWNQKIASIERGNLAFFDARRTVDVDQHVLVIKHADIRPNNTTEVKEIGQDIEGENISGSQPRPGAT